MNMKLGVLVGSGRQTALLAFPFLVVGTALNVLRPTWFAVGGPPLALSIVSAVVLSAGMVVWAWSVYQLITGGPYAVMKHPLYTGAVLLVLPWLGFLCNSWLGVVVGGVLYAGCRLYAPAEEKMLSQIFGPAWHEYSNGVVVPWL
jgi:protein-S-isoprenylcysteine O-methyltransferase Ste14